MNRNTYRETRRLIRDNGFFALKWMTETEARTWRTLRNIALSEDLLKDRAAYMKRLINTSTGRPTTPANVIRLTSIIGAWSRVTF